MWLTGVPTDVIITVYGVVVVCVAGWTIVARSHRPQADNYPPHGRGDGMDLYDDLPTAYPSTFGA